MPQRPGSRNLIEDQYFIQEKYGIDERDYAGRSQFDYDMQKYVGALYGMSWYSKRPRDFTPLEKEAHDTYRALLKSEPPYWDFWHFVLDIYGSCIQNDTHFHNWNWGVILKEARREWQREIAQLYVNEFGDRDILYWISW